MDLKKSLNPKSLIQSDSRVPGVGIPKIAFVAFQGARRANGGMDSLFEIVSRLEPSVVTLYSQHDSQMMEKWRNAGVPVEIIPTQSPNESSVTWRGLLRWNSELTARLKTNKPDVVVCNDILAFDE